MKPLLCLALLVQTIDASILQTMVEKWVVGNVKGTLQEMEDSRCKEDLVRTYMGVRKRELWALKMLDASSKLATNILRGNQDVGNYDECLSIANNGIRGKYCVARMGPSRRHSASAFLERPMTVIKHFKVPIGRDNKFADKVNITSAFCVPSSCRAGQLQQLTDIAESKLNLFHHNTFSEEFCDDGTPEEATFAYFAAMSFFALIAVILVLASFSTNPYLRSFNLARNFERLTTVDGQENSLGVLSGLRCICFFVILYGHVHLNTSMVPMFNAFEMFYEKYHLRGLQVAVAPMSVEIYFLLSGFLIVYLTMGMQEVPLKLFYLKRFVRLFPPFIAAVIFNACIMRYTGDGPSWMYLKNTYIRYCEDNWWSALLFVQNYIHPIDGCLQIAWYLSVDTHLYMLSPIIFVSLKKNSRVTLYFLSIGIFAGMGVAYYTTVKYNIGSTLFDFDNEYLIKYYYPTHTRASSWLVGTLFGYTLHTLEKNNIIFTKSTLVAGWVGTSAIIAAIVYAHCHIVIRPLDPLTSGLFNALARPAWCMAFGWIIVACSRGHGGIINTILSAPTFRVLARLNYSMYLLHFPIQQYYIFQLRGPTYFSFTTMFSASIGFYMITVAVSVVWYLAFEAPVVELQKFLVSRRTMLEKSSGRDFEVNTEKLK